MLRAVISKEMRLSSSVRGDESLQEKCLKEDLRQLTAIQLENVKVSVTDKLFALAISDSGIYL